MIHLDASRRDGALVAAWQSTRARRDWSFDEFLSLTNEWTVHPIIVRGVIAGAVMQNGPELHACVLPEFFGIWMSKRFVRLIDEVIGTYGCAVTYCKTKEGVDFVKRLGFDLSRCDGETMEFVKWA